MDYSSAPRNEVQKNSHSINQLTDKEVQMKDEFHYKCPLESNCSLHKHCHVIKTAERLKTIIPAIVKCPAKKNKEIVVQIGADRQR